MPIEKPSFPTLTPAQLQEGFDKLKDTVEDVRQKNGKLSMNKLSAEVQKADDPTMRAALEVFKDTYQETKTVRVSSGGCGGSYTTSRTGPKTKLGSDEVKSVLSMLTAAKRRVAKLDSNVDGVIDIGEAKAASKMGGLSGKLVKAALKKTVGEYVNDLRQWTYDLMRVEGNVSERQNIEQDVKDISAHHCKHKNGAKAVAWALRELASREKFSDWDANRTLDFAEQLKDANPLLAHMERAYGNRSNERLPKGHLDNKEVRDLLNTDDLDGFVREMRGQVEKNLGQGYFEYLKGRDLEGVEQLDNPDFKNKTAWELSNIERANTGC